MTDQTPKWKLVSDFVYHKIQMLKNSNKDAEVRAKLARLRHGIGDAPGSDPEVWNETIAELPEALYSNQSWELNDASKAEWAIHIALTLFALHQQGSDIKSDCKHHEKFVLGRAIQKLAGGREDAGYEAVRRRFNATVTSESIEEFSHHLRGLVQLLKAKDIPLDYVDLASDIYRFQFTENRDKLRLKWGQDFYSGSSTNVTA